MPPNCTAERSWKEDLRHATKNRGQGAWRRAKKVSPALREPSSTDSPDSSITSAREMWRPLRDLNARPQD